VISYLIRGLAARFRAGRLVFLLSVFGVALGVASVVSIQVINQNAVGAFAGSVRAVSGEADLTLIGRSPVLAESLFAEVLAVPGVEEAWPVYRLQVAVDSEAEEVLYLEVVGLDMATPRRGLPWGQGPERPWEVFQLPGWVAVSPALATELGLAIGDSIPVSIGDRRARLTIGALIDFSRVSPSAGSRLTVMDIAQAQSLLGRPGELHQIDVRVAAGSSLETVQADLVRRLGPAVQVLTPAERRGQAVRLLEAFRLNLTALSLVSLFVGAFLVFSSTQALLMRRRRELGVLRTLGATRAQLLGLLLGEALLTGILGVAIGIPIGIRVAEANIGTVSATLANLYLLQEIEKLELSFGLYLLAVLIGGGASVLGALLPSLEMSRRDPRALLAAFSLHERLASHALRLAVMAAALVMLAYVAVTLFGSEWKPRGFALGLVLLIAVPLVAPLLVRGGSRWIRAGGFGIPYGIKSLGLRLHTTVMAVAALAVAVSMLVAVTLLIGSFRRTVGIWVEETARADVYVTSESWRRARREAVLEERLIDRIAATPGVRAVDRFRQFYAYTGERRISVAGIDSDVPGSAGRFSLLSGDAATLPSRLREEGAVAIGEPLSRKEGLAVGDTLRLFGPGGEVGLGIAAVYYDYTSEAGSAVMDLGTLASIFGPGPVNNIALYLEDGVPPGLMVDRLKSAFPEEPLLIRSNRMLREEIFSIFDQTFAVTRLLQVMSLLIAVSGVALTLLVMARELISELALYRALGAHRAQVFRIFLGKGMGMTVLGILLGFAVGLGLAMILIYMINRAYFGWTIALHWPWGALAAQVGLILAAALAASLYPALRASRTPATELSREDV
jgi:putative ABC transport system permease protein